MIRLFVNRRRGGVRGLPAAAMACLLLPSLAAAQARVGAPSPAAPNDMTKPQFDTETPLFDKIGQAGKAATTVVAEVDGRAITLGQVGDAIRALSPGLRDKPFELLYHDVLTRLIRRQALVIQAQHMGLDDDPAIRRRVQAAADDALSDAYLERQTTSAITEKRLLDTYKTLIADQPGPEEVHVRLILLAARQDAMDAIKQLTDGADFATVARRISKDATAPSGGDLGFVRREDLNPEVSAVAFSLAPGHFDPYPVRSKGAWFIVKTEERRHGVVPSYVTTRDNLVTYLRLQGVAGVVDAAMKSVTVREYSISGKETESAQPK